MDNGWVLEVSGKNYRIWGGTEDYPMFVAEFDNLEDAKLCVSCVNRVSGEIKNLKRDNEVLYRDNVTMSEAADRLREALEELASNFNAIRSASQPYADMIDSWHYIARAALEVK